MMGGWREVQAAYLTWRILGKKSLVGEGPGNKDLKTSTKSISGGKKRGSRVRTPVLNKNTEVMILPKRGPAGAASGHQDLKDKNRLFDRNDSSATPNRENRAA